VNKGKKKRKRTEVILASVHSFTSVRDWMNTHSWLLNIITCGVFIALIL